MSRRGSKSTTMIWLRIEYLVEELSIWRAGELESVAVNSPYLVRKHVIRRKRCAGITLIFPPVV